jgi:hypothetical protein
MAKWDVRANNDDPDSALLATVESRSDGTLFIWVTLNPVPVKKAEQIRLAIASAIGDAEAFGDSVAGVDPSPSTDAATNPDEVGERNV